jgi:hypothetical protein
MDYMHHRSSRQHKLPDSTAVAENRIAGGVGGERAQSRFLDPIEIGRRLKTGRFYSLREDLFLTH